MVTLLISCSHCQSTEIVRNGAPAEARPNGYTEAEREPILRAYQERSRLRGLTRTFGVSRNTVTSWLKKISRAPALEYHRRDLPVF